MTDLSVDGFGHYLAGLIDGEGCFRIHSQRRGDYYACAFSMRLRDDDRAILDEIVARTGVGKVYTQAAYATSRPGAVWRVQSRAGCWGLARILDVFPLRAKKAADYAEWRRALETIATMPRGNRWHGPRDWTPMIEHKRRIEAGRAYR